MGAIQVGHFYTRNLDEHMRLIRRQVERSIRDPSTRQLAVKIVSGAFEWRRNPRTGQQAPYIKEWGRYFFAPVQEVCPPRDEECEIVRIWDFTILNFRYVYDPDQIDLFATVKQSLDAGGGDCDDATILMGSLLRSIGFKVKARVIATQENPGDWAHVYPIVGMPKDSPEEWLPLDMTVTGALPGWEYPDIASYQDFNLW